eukprot:CAMPEP_0195570478 /NCGR_PEP_ID=MMETSP0814-20130614/3482_1 /TAXON_ID=97485 /ORGANISM="Prymnesium parvum, Strain Texoma1" /LENGTH=99 /DNA_ID=CAMNT_0040705979 /DNA_START=424 /DNA_END=723 /DNA_ORIENTATION=+
MNGQGRVVLTSNQSGRRKTERIAPESSTMSESAMAETLAWKTSTMGVVVGGRMYTRVYCNIVDDASAKCAETHVCEEYSRITERNATTSSGDNADARAT